MKYPQWICDFLLIIEACVLSVLHLWATLRMLVLWVGQGCTSVKFISGLGRWRKSAKLLLYCKQPGGNKLSKCIWHNINQWSVLGYFNPALVTWSFETCGNLLVPLFVLCLHVLILLYDKDTSMGFSSAPGNQRIVKAFGRQFVWLFTVKRWNWLDW